MSIYGGPDIITDGLILYWDVANPKSYTNGSSSIYDLSGNNYTGTTSNVTYSSSFNGIISTSGTATSNIVISSSTFSRLSLNFTAVAATRYINTGTRFLNADTNNWLLGHYYSSDAYYAAGWVNTGTVTDNKWRIYTGTGDISNDVWNFYINGTLLASNNGGAQGPAGIRIGGFGTEYSAGQFSFLQIYNRVLTSSEVLQNYNALKGRFGL